MIASARPESSTQSTHTTLMQSQPTLMLCPCSCSVSDSRRAEESQRKPGGALPLCSLHAFKLSVRPGKYIVVSTEIWSSTTVSPHIRMIMWHWRLSRCLNSAAHHRNKYLQYIQIKTSVLNYNHIYSITVYCIFDQINADLSRGDFFQKHLQNLKVAHDGHVEMWCHWINNKIFKQRFMIIVVIVQKKNFFGQCQLVYYLIYTI